MCGFSNCRMRFGLSALLQQFRNDTRPAGLMARSDARPVVSVEIFVEQDQIAPMRVVAVLGSLVYRPSAVLISQKYPRQAARDLRCDFPERHVLARTGRTLNLEVVTQIVMELLERLDQQIVHGEPDGATPIRISSEQSSARLARLIVDSIFHSIDGKPVG